MSILGAQKIKSSLCWLLQDLNQSGMKMPST